MQPVETTSGAWTARLLAAFAAYGLEPGSLCRSVGLQLVLLEDADAPVALAAWSKLWREAERVSRDRDLGLHVGEVAPIDPYLIGGYALAAAQSLGSFARDHLDLQRLTFHADFFTFRERGEIVDLCFAAAPGYEPTRHAVDYAAVMFLRYFRSHFSILPTRIGFRHPSPVDWREYSRICACRIDFNGADNAFAFRRGDFTKPRGQFSEATFYRLSQAADQALAEVEPRSFGEQVRTVLHRRLGRRPVDVSSVSGALHVSTRTLQRRLAEESTSFNRQLDLVRHRIGVERVRGNASLRDAARATGFGEIASFCRAFRRWTGRTPASYRNMQQTLRRAS